MLAMLVTLGLIGPACARQAQPVGGATVSVGLGERGETVVLDPGDRLVVDLGPAESVEPAVDGADRTAASWGLAAYPDRALLLTTKDPARGRFEFEAEAGGTGRILVLGDINIRDVCAGPGPLGGNACPVAGEVGTDAPPRPLAFSIVVRVEG